MERLTDPIVPEGDGQTPLGPDETHGLRLSHVATRGELNEAEQRNILDAVATRTRPTVDELLDDLYLRRLHKDMFGRVWAWAGTYRTRETNLGFDPAHIATAVKNLVADAKHWPGSEPPDAVAARFHHRLVQIHPFPNGNGRHGRVAADYLALALGAPALTWGADSGLPADEVRTRYLTALRDADQGRMDSLVAFVRS